MAFSEIVIQAAWNRAGGQCQCKRISHVHTHRRCNKRLIWDKRGISGEQGCWQACHLAASGRNSISNCEILCIECHDGKEK